MCCWNTGQTKMATGGTESRGILPVFIKHTDLGVENNQQLKEYVICKELCKVIDRDELEGVQRVRGLWRLYLTTAEARLKLLTAGFVFNGIAVSLYDQNPFRLIETSSDPLQKMTKVTISNLPLSICNEEIEVMLKSMDCEMQTKVGYDFVRDDENNLTTIKNGNRSVLVASEYIQDHPLPRNAYCGNWRCSIFYFNQPKPVVKCFNCGRTGHTQNRCRLERVCKACGNTGHFEGTVQCNLYKRNNAHVFGGESDILSNLHPCPVTWQELNFASAEHAYTYAKAIDNNRKDIAVNMTRSRDPQEAKRESRKIVTTNGWKEKRTEIMKEVVEAKLKGNEDVGKELLSTGERVLAEAVTGQDNWGTGLSKRVSQNTDPEMWPGKNTLGRIYMDMREKLRQQEEEFKVVEGTKRKAEEEMDDNPTTKQRQNGTTPIKDNISKENTVENLEDEPTQQSSPCSR